MRRAAPASSDTMRLYWENVSQALIWPLFMPAVSHFARWTEEPWVKLSGTA